MIHSTAIIGDNVKLGQGVEIGPYCIVGDGAVLEDGVILKSHIVMEGSVHIGSGTKIHPFASLSYPQTLKYRGEDSAIIIGSNTTIREYVTIQHGTEEDAMVTKIGNNCLLMVGVHIAHNCSIGDNAIFANYVNLAGHVKVGDFVTIGGLVGVQQFCRIGSHTMIGGASALDKDLVPYALASGNRAYIDGLNLVGLKRRGFDKSHLLDASNAIKEIFSNSSDLLFYERLEEVRNNHANNPLVHDMIEFIRSQPERSYCRYRE